MVVLSTIITYAAIIAFVRLAGLRSFSKMSASDFAMTLAVGSLFASTISSPSPTVFVTLVALAVLFAGQWIFAYLRVRSDGFSAAVDNRPLLLMRGAHILDANMKRANVSREDLFAKLREANVLRYEQIHAVVFETTGDISVLHGEEDSFHSDMLTGVVD